LVLPDQIQFFLAQIIQVLPSTTQQLEEEVAQHLEEVAAVEIPIAVVELARVDKDLQVVTAHNLLANVGVSRFIVLVLVITKLIWVAVAELVLQVMELTGVMVLRLPSQVPQSHMLEAAGDVVFAPATSLQVAQDQDSRIMVAAAM
jgi:hypothetical protein|tara:strand:+ start:161 stop:598 length:438 start_codon:yes stop_codon:yes gene_type:complete